MEMTLKEFIAKYLNKPVDYDGQYGSQCVDLFRYYVRDVLGISQPKGVKGAKDFWGNYDTDPVLNQNFLKIVNAATNSPKEGDVVIWGMGKYGHIAIATGEGNTSKFKSWDQNWNGVQKVQLVEHNYNDVLGWFTLKDQKDYKDLYEKLQKKYDLLRTKWNNRDKEFDLLNEENKAMKAEIDKMTTEFGQAVTDLRANNAEWKKKCEDLADLNIKLMEETKLLNAIKNAVLSLFKK